MSKAARAAADAAEAAAAAEARRVESVAAAMPPSRVGSDGRDSRGRAGGGAGTGSEAARRDSARREAQASAAAAAELEAIRAQYSGGATAKRKVPAKPADKFKFLFDWAPEQDTSRPAAAGVPSAPEVLQFGRGLRAGMDRLQQRTAAADHTASLIAARAVTGAQSPGEAAAAALAARAASAAGLASEARYERIAATVAKPTHWKAKSLSEMTDRDWRIFREDHAMSLKGGRLPLPFRSWDESGLPDLILKAVVAVGYTVPSPIQMAAIPIGLAGRDLIGIAETGSGKTCAFVLPMLAYIMRLPLMAGDEAREALGPYALILSPTRELAQQTEEETAKFAKFLNYRAVSIVGGQNIEEQGFALRNGCEVIIGTPGRVMDCLERRYTVLHQCNFVVLDEADRMIDYGFEPQGAELRVFNRLVPHATSILSCQGIGHDAKQQFEARGRRGGGCCAASGGSCGQSISHHVHVLRHHAVHRGAPRAYIHAPPRGGDHRERGQSSIAHQTKRAHDARRRQARRA